MPGRVMITREEAEPLASLLSARGLVPVHLPLVRLLPTGAAPPVARPGQVLLTSAAAIEHAPGLGDWVGSARVVVVGERTAEAARAAGLRVDEIASGRGEDALARLDPTRGPIVFVGAARPAPAVAAALDAGALLHWPVYDRRDEAPSPAAGRTVPADLVTLASPAAAAAWARWAGGADLPVVAIGETTAAAARAVGLRVLRVAERPDLEALAEAAAAALREA